MTIFKLTNDDLGQSQVYYSNKGTYYAQGDLAEYKTKTPTTTANVTVNFVGVRPKNDLTQTHTGWSPGIDGISFGTNPDVPARNDVGSPAPNPVVVEESERKRKYDGGGESRKSKRRPRDERKRKKISSVFEYAQNLSTPSLRATKQRRKDQAMMVNQ